MQGTKQSRTLESLRQLKAGLTPAVQYKGCTIIFINGYYRAAAYANPTFEETNKVKLLQSINSYLRS